jgi:hypothetical protein
MEIAVIFGKARVERADYISRKVVRTPRVSGLSQSFQDMRSVRQRFEAQGPGEQALCVAECHV